MRRAARPAQSLESDHQIALFEWAAMVPLPELRLLYANANGGARHKATAGRLKAEGVKPGVPDLCLPVARHGYHGLYIELKRPKEGPGTRAGKTSDDQDAWIAALTAEGYRAVVCYGWVEASEEIMRYLGGAPCCAGQPRRGRRLGAHALRLLAHHSTTSRPTTTSAVVQIASSGFLSHGLPAGLASSSG